MGETQANAKNPGLDERSRAILDFERDSYTLSGSKEDAIRHTFSLSPARYYQLLNQLLSSQAAIEYDPLLIGRLVRVRDERTRTRSQGVSGSGRKN